MAQKPSGRSRKGSSRAARGARPRPSAQPPDPRQRAVAAALRLAAVRDGWRRLSLAAIAHEAGLSLAELRRAVPSKQAILAAFLTEIDAQVLAAGQVDADESARDRLFEVVMRRFDALAPYKDAVAAIVRDAGTDPMTLLALGPPFLYGMAWMVEAAHLSSSGLQGLVRTNVLACVYAGAFRTWLADDS